MKSMPTDDKLFGKGTIRQDGRKIHDMYLFEVKKPEESKAPVGLLQDARHHPRRPRRSVRSIKANARWSSSRRRRPWDDPRRLQARDLPVEEHRAMFELIGVPPQALFGQLLLGLINGAFYALLSLGSPSSSAS